MKVVDRVLLDHELWRLLNEVEVNSESPHEKLLGFVIQSVDLHAERGILLNSSVYVLFVFVISLVKLVFLCDHVVVVQLDAFELALDCEVLGFLAQSV